MHKLCPVCQDFGHMPMTGEVVIGKLWQADIIKITKEMHLPLRQKWIKGIDKKCPVHKVAEINGKEIVMSLLDQRGKCLSVVPSYVTGPKSRREPFPQCE